MPEFAFDPPLPTAAVPDEQRLAGFLQTLTLKDDAGKPIGLARWHAPGGLTEGVVQILELTIAEPHRRRGHAGRLLKATIDQAVRYHRLHKQPLRRLWFSIEQKTQVNARAFLTQHGFHQTGTISDLLKSQDALIYVRSLD